MPSLEPRTPPQAGTSRWPALAPFQSPAFRRQWPADLATAWALEMETIILGWYMLVESGSVLMLTVFGALMYVGTLLSPLLGTLGDHFGLRRLLGAMRLWYFLMAGVILLLALGGLLRPGAVLLLAFLVGLVKPSDIGMRTALVSANVPPAHLVAAMGISRTTQDSARIGGALAGAGFMASVGMVGAYGLVATLYLAAAVVTWRGPPQVPHAAGVAAPSRAKPAAHWREHGRELKAGLAHVWHTPSLRAAMAVAALANLCAFPLSGGLMPYIARDVFGQGQQGLGWLVASYASGALLGSLTMSAVGMRLPAGRTMLAASALWLLFLLGLALPIRMATAMALYLGAGLMQSMAMLALQLILVRQSQPVFRGRVMGVRMLAIYTLPLGLLAAGFLIPRVGFGGLVAVYCGLGLVLLAGIAWGWRRALWAPAAPANALHGPA